MTAAQPADALPDGWEVLDVDFDIENINLLWQGANRMRKYTFGQCNDKHGAQAVRRKRTKTKTIRRILVL